jgi:hypothetical protein
MNARCRRKTFGYANFGDLPLAKVVRNREIAPGYTPAAEKEFAAIRADYLQIKARVRHGI